MTREQCIEGQLRRVVEAVKHGGCELDCSLKTRLVEEALQSWKTSHHTHTGATVHALDAFSEAGVVTGWDPHKRQRLRTLMHELGCAPALRQRLVFGTPEMGNASVCMSFKDALLTFLCHLSQGQSPLPPPAEYKGSVPAAEAALQKLRDAIDQLQPASDEGSWTQCCRHFENVSLKGALERFQFGGKENEQPVVHVPALRLWDFITLKGSALVAGLSRGVWEEGGWNQRGLEMAEFEKAPSTNPLIMGYAANGICEISLDETDGASGLGTGHPGASQKPAPLSRELFEKELIPVVLLALDGVPPALRSLETASTQHKAASLHKLLSKVTRCGHLRHDLDRLVERPLCSDEIKMTFFTAVQSILRFHSASLQRAKDSIQRRQRLDRPLPQSGCQAGHVSLIETVVHTEALQKQVMTLASICCVSRGTEPSADKLPSGTALLSRLYAELLEADDQSGPVIRQPSTSLAVEGALLMRKWLYTADDVFEASFREGTSIELPVFLEAVAETFFEAGQQLRIIRNLCTELKAEEAIAAALRQIAETEEFEMGQTCERLNDPWALCQTGHCELGISAILSGGCPPSVPLPFQHNALHEVGPLSAGCVSSNGREWLQVVQVMSGAAQDRSEEVRHILKTAQEIRSLEKEMLNADRRRSFRTRMAGIERLRREAMQEALEKRKRQQELLTEQKAAINERSARKAAEKSEGLRQELEMMRAAAKREHAEALNLLKREMGLDQRLKKADVEMDVDDVLVEEKARDERVMEIDEAAPPLAVSRARWSSAATSIVELPLLKSGPSENTEIQPDEKSATREMTEADMDLAEGTRAGAESLVEDVSLVPLSAVIDGCVLQPIFAQHKCVSYAFSVIFCEEFGFVDAVRFMKRFYFSEASDWIAALVEHLFQHLSRGLDLTVRALDAIFEASILESSYAELPPSPHIALSLRLTPAEDSLNDTASAELVSRLSLTARVEWPLSLVITPESLENYNVVFRMFLRVRQTRWWLESLWSRFTEVRSHGRPPLDLQIRLKCTRLWYQDAVNIVTMLQSYMHHELNFNRWAVFQERMRQSSLSFRKIRDAHAEYLNSAIDGCFQKPNAKRLRSMLESALQSIIHFCELLRASPKEAERHVPVLLCLVRDDEIWEQLKRLSAEVKHRSCAFYKTLKYRANRGECTEGLYVLMSFNAYYAAPK